VPFVSPFSEREKLETLFDRHGSDVFNFSLRVAGTREAASRATKAAFLALGRDPERNPLAGARREGEPNLLAGTRREPRLSLLAEARRETAELLGDPHRDPVPDGWRLPLQQANGLPVQEANGRLAVPHREALALRELAGCSYEELGRIVGADREAVAALLWQARLALRDELAQSRLLSIAPVASSCRRALALIVMHSDGELHDAGERAWLRRHLRTCGKCRLSQEAVRQASTCYRDWPAAPVPLGMRESLSSSDPAGRPAAGSGRSSRSRPGSPPRGARRGARRSPG
jgi:DNA-directed RNA polymerase specialized sigma24 family protein